MIRSRIPYIFTLFLVACTAMFGQAGDRVLATATGVVVKSSDLSPEGRKLVDDQMQLIAEDRRSTFENWIFEELLKTEAKARGVTLEKVETEAVAKAPSPTEAQIKAVYDANRDSIGSRMLDQVRPSIVEFLRREAESKQLIALNTELRAKHKFVEGKDVRTAFLSSDVAATIGVRKITVGEFQIANRISLYNFRARIHESIRGELEDVIYLKLLEIEAKKRNTDASGLLAEEISSKLKDFTDYERMYLDDMLQARLFRDYAVKLNIPNLEPQSLAVLPDDDPSIGPSTARVTVVAFVDFQCSACAAFSPILKQVVKEFGSSARLIVRDYPLTSIHDNAMQAARAGYAARQQGKFFEMGDLMYRNQDKLDAGSLLGYAKQLGMDIAKFDVDMKSPAAAAEISKDINDGNSYGVSGTPTIFVNGVQIFRLAPARVREAIKQGLK